MLHRDIADRPFARGGGLLPTAQPAQPARGQFFQFRTVRVAFNFTAVALLFLVGLGTAGCAKKKNESSGPPEVQVITLEPRDVPIYKDWIGTLDGFDNAQIRAQVTGYLLTQNYKEGSRVKKGDVLFEIDPRPFEATLAQAEAKLAQDRAQQGKTRLDVKRFEPLAKDKSISQQELDNAVQADLAADAQVKADEAAVNLARVNLDFTKITAPIDGIAGLATAQIGDLVGPSGMALTTVSTVDPIKVYFPVTEQSYLDFWGQFAAPKRDGTQEAPPELQLFLGDGKPYPEKGKFFFTDRQVNVTTGTIQVAGVFPNEDHMLRPGQYARVRALTHFWHGAVVVPQRAVSELQGSAQLTIVEDVKGTNTARVRTVKLADRIGSDWVVESGVKAGDRVIVEGLLKAKDNKEVIPKPYVPPAGNGGTIAEKNAP